MKKIQLGSRILEIALSKDERIQMKKERERKEKEEARIRAIQEKEEAKIRAAKEKALMQEQARKEKEERARQKEELQKQKQQEKEQQRISAREELEARKQREKEAIEEKRRQKAKEQEEKKKRQQEALLQKQRDERKRAEEKQEKKKNKKPMKLSFKALRQEIEQYGFEFSMRKVFTQVGIVALVMIAGTFYYQLNIIGTIIVILSVLLFSTIIVSFNYKFRYHIEIFNEASAYMENLIYAFLKKPKIREALLDTVMSVTDTRIEKKILEAIDFIDTSTSNNLYKDAFAIIEEEFGCPKMRQIHEYLIKVEEEGGAYEESLFVLLENLQEWIRITNNYQAEKQKIKSNMIMSIMLAGGLAGIINTRLPEQFAVSNYPIYQVASTLFLIFLFLSYLFVQWRLTGSLIKEKGERSDKQIVKDYMAFKSFNMAKERRKAIIMSIIVVILGIVIGFTFGKIYGGLLIFAAVYNLSSPNRKKKHIKQRLEKDIRKAFPAYLMGIALELQTETVQTAIEKSLNDAPTILKPAIKKLITELEDNPSAYEPYDTFLSEFNVPEIRSGMKTFYAINNLADVEATKQINSLIHRNNQANIKAEEMKVEDEVKAKSFMIMIPMLLTIPYMLVSLGLLFVNFLHLMGTANPTIK